MRRRSKYFIVFCIPFVLYASAEERLAELTLEEKVGQLFIAPFCPPRSGLHRDDWIRLMQHCCIGNVIVKQSDPRSQIEGLNWIQALSSIPLLVCSDSEWGLAMRMSDTIAYPKNIILGALQNCLLVEELGAEIGRQARLVGVHLNLAPVLDVNSNPDNPIIGDRSFGADPEKVASMGAAMIRGLHSAGLLACAKHFPGHGDTRIDSHLALPRIDSDLDRLLQVDLPPFLSAIDENVDAIMTAHILFPALDPHFPASLSKTILTDFLRGQLHYNGLIITDALNMKALTAHWTVAEIVLQAHLAGADLLLYGDHLSDAVDSLLEETLPKAVTALVSAYKNHEIPIERLDASVLRILKAKEAVHLFPFCPLQPDPLLNTPYALDLNARLRQ